MRSFLRSVDLLNGAELILGRPLPADVSILSRSTRPPRRVRLDGAATGILEGNDGLSATLDRQGRIRAVTLHYPAEVSGGLPNRLASRLGQWQSEATDVVRKEYVWQGRAESVYLVLLSAGDARLSISDPRLR